MSAFLIFAIIGAILEVTGFTIGIVNLFKTPKRLFTGTQASVASTFRTHIVAIGICGFGSMILVTDLVAYILHRCL